MTTATSLKTKPSKLEDLGNKTKAIQNAMSMGEGETVEVAEDIFEETLPEGLSMETVLAVDAAKADFMAASTEALGNFSATAMKKDKKLERLGFQIPIGKDSFGVTIQRTAEVKAGIEKDSGTKTVHGLVTAKYKVHSGSKSRGTLKQVVTKIQDQFTEMFGE